MIKLPKKIKVSGREIEIKFPYEFKERGDCDGTYCHGNETLMIEGGESDNHTLFILLHELIHAMAKVTGCERLYNDDNTIDAIAETLLQVMKDNPEFVKLFMPVREYGSRIGD